MALRGCLKTSTRAEMWKRAISADRIGFGGKTLPVGLAQMARKRESSRSGDLVAYRQFDITTFQRKTAFRGGRSCAGYTASPGDALVPVPKLGQEICPRPPSRSLLIGHSGGVVEIMLAKGETAMFMSHRLRMLPNTQNRWEHTKKWDIRGNFGYHAGK
jgi:hypothetical protein